MDTCLRISDLASSSGYEMQVMGVPKTIDNDLAATDHCPGYGSAARFLALAVRDTGLDLEAMATFEDVVILEAMGRNAGWLAALRAWRKSSGRSARTWSMSRSWPSMRMTSWRRYAGARSAWAGLCRGV